MFKRVSYKEYIDHSQLFDSLEAIVDRYAKCLESDEIDLEAFNALIAFFSEEAGLNNLDIDFDYIQWQCVFDFYEAALDVLLTVENRLLDRAVDRLRWNFRVTSDREYFKRMLVLNAEQFACVVECVRETRSRLTEILGRLREYSKRFRTGTLVEGDAVDMVSQALGMVDGARHAMVERLDVELRSSEAFKLEDVYGACRDDILFSTRIERRLPFLVYPLLAMALRRKDLKMISSLAGENGLSNEGLHSFFESENFRGVSDDEELVDFLLDVLANTRAGRMIEFEESEGSWTARAGERLTGNYRGQRAFLGALLARMVVERAKNVKVETGAMVHALPAWARDVRDQSPVALEVVREAMAIVNEPGQVRLEAARRWLFGPSVYQRCQDLVEGFELDEAVAADMNTSLRSHEEAKSEVEFLGRVAEFLEGREGLEEPLLNVYRKLLSLSEAQKAAQQNAAGTGKKKKKKKRIVKTPLEKRIARCKGRIKSLTSVLEDRRLRGNAVPTIRRDFDELFERGVGAVNLREVNRALSFSEANVESAREYLLQGFLGCLGDVDVTQANTVEVYDLYKTLRRTAHASKLTHIVGICDSISADLIQRIDHDEAAIFWLNWPTVIRINDKGALRTVLLEFRRHLDRFDHDDMYCLRTLRGLVLAELKEVDEAYKVLNGLASDTEHLTEEYAFIARAYLSFVRYEKKERTGAKAIDDELKRKANDSQNAKLHYVLGRTRYHKRKYNAALVALGNARALDSDYEDPMWILTFWAAKEKADKVAPYYKATEVRMTPWHFAQINLPSYSYFIGKLKEAGLFEHYRELYRERALRDLIKKLQAGMPFWDDDFEESESASERIADLYEDLYAGGLVLQMTTPQLQPYLGDMEKRDLFVMNGFVIEMLGSGLGVDIVSKLLSIGRKGQPVDILALRLDAVRGRVSDGEIANPKSLACDLRQRIEKGAYRNHLIDQDLVIGYLGQIESGSNENLVLEPSNSKRVAISPTDFLGRLRYLVDTYDKLHEELAEASNLVAERQRRKREREGKFLLQLTEQSPNTRFTRSLVTIAGVSTVNPMADLFYVEDAEPGIFDVSGIAVFITNTWDPDEAKAQVEKLLGHRSPKNITIRY